MSNLIITYDAFFAIIKTIISRVNTSVGNEKAPIKTATSTKGPVQIVNLEEGAEGGGSSSGGSVPTYTGNGNGPLCPDLPGKLKGDTVKSKIKNAYGTYVKGNVSFIAKLEIAYDNFVSYGNTVNITKGRALVGDSWRSFSFQQKAYNDWVAGGKNGPVKASPCSGYHVAGQAIDLDQGGSYTTLKGEKVLLLTDITSHGILYKCLYDAGLRRVSNEWWHWSIGEAKHDINKRFVKHDGSPGDWTKFITY